MACYVDQLRGCQPNAKWKWNRSCHLFAESEAELMTFARQLGLRPEWLHDSKGFRHFDLTPAKRERAVRMGAIEMGARFVVEFARAARARLTMPSKEFAASVAETLNADQVILFVRQIGDDGVPTLRFVSWGSTPEIQRDAARLADHAYEGIIEAEESAAIISDHAEEDEA